MKKLNDGLKFELSWLERKYPTCPNKQLRLSSIALVGSGWSQMPCPAWIMHEETTQGVWPDRRKWAHVRNSSVKLHPPANTGARELTFLIMFCNSLIIIIMWNWRIRKCKILENFCRIFSDLMIVIQMNFSTCSPPWNNSSNLLPMSLRGAAQCSMIWSSSREHPTPTTLPTENHS